MKKRILSLLLTLVMVLGILPVTAYAEKFTDPAIDFIDVTDPDNLGRAVTDGNGHYVDTFAYAAKQEGYIWLEKITLDSAIAWSTEGSTTPVDTVDKVEGTRYVNKKWLSYENDGHTLGKYDGEYVWVTLQSIKLYDIKNQCYVEPTTSAWLTLDPDNDALSGGDVVPVGMYAQEYYYDVWTDLYLEYFEPMWVGFPSGSENMTVTMDGQTLKPRSEAWTESLGSHTPGMYWVMGGGTAGSSFKTTYPSIARTLYVNSPVHYVYDVKPEIKSVTVNGTSVADGATYVSNSKSVTVKTTYDSVLSQALQDYGCTVKYKTSLNGVDYSNVTTSTSNGNGTSTQTYVQNVNSGSSLTFKSWLEVTWPNGSKDRVDERTVTVMYVDVDFESISPVPTSTELTNKYTDLGTMDLGSSATNIDFKAFPKDLPAAAISDGWTTGRSITVTRDGVDFYSKTYASNELYGWNLKDNISEGGKYKITLKVFAQKGSQTYEKTHTYQINVKGSTIKTIALTGVGTPVIGKAPSTINTVKCNTDGVIVKKVVWTYYTSEMGGTWLNMPSGSKFEAGKRYAVSIEMKPADGYSFTANKSDMTVYINGEVARKSINYSSSEFAADLEFTPITTPTFTTQPVGGEAPNGGTYTVNWATNFTPVKIVVGEYNFRGSIVRGTEYSGDLTSIALKPNTYGYAIIAYYNDDYAAYSSKITITEAPLIEIKTVDVTIAAPVEGNKPSYTASVPADAGYTVKARYDGGYTKGVMWETNGEWMHGETKFEGGQDYVFTVLIQPKEGYEFYYAEGNNTTEPNVAVTVNGNPAIFNKDSNWLIVQYRFTVKGITLTGSTTGGVKVAVENLKNSATLIVAQYEGGKMVDVQMQTVSADNTYGFAGLTHKTGCTYKAFLVNSTSYAPLCAADEF